MLKLNVLSSIDVCNARMVYNVKRIACISSSLFYHQFHGAVDFWNSTNSKIYDGALFA